MSGSISGAPPRSIPTILELFVAFAIISLSGFGGVLYWSRRMLVERRKWMTPAEFNDAYALCQILPGPTIVNLSVVFGRSIRGVPGAVVALIGLIGPGMAIVIMLGALYSVFGNIEALQRMLTGVAAAAAGLVIGITGKMAQPLLEQRTWLVNLLVAGAVFVAVGLLRWPIWWVLLVLIPISIAIAWRAPS
ncbi:MAG: chromate transporter [Hyphomicrobiales bacterium]|nr:chromate transporter [Hyphomicrobiales bacterium]